MRVPERLHGLLREGVITEVVRPLMSGKEAQVYLVASGDQLGVAKIYKEATQRTFKHRATYTEGRGTRNTRDARAMKKRSTHGRAVDEAAWRSAEVDVIYRLRDAGVRVPEPYAFVDGVLIMELVTDAEGNPAPRLGEVELDREIAPLFFEVLLREVVRMTCAGVVHGDLSEFNVLVGPDGPVIIDFPQAVDPAQNPNARRLLLRDVENLVGFIARYDPRMKGRPYGPELWDLYERAKLHPETVLTGRWRRGEQQTPVDTGAVLRELLDVESERARSERAPRGRSRVSDPPASRGRPTDPGARRREAGSGAHQPRREVVIERSAPGSKPGHGGRSGRRSARR